MTLKRQFKKKPNSAFMLSYTKLPGYLCRAKDGRHLQLSVILLFSGVNDQSDVAAAAGGELPERSDDVVLHRKPGPRDTLRRSQRLRNKECLSNRRGTELKRTHLSTERFSWPIMNCRLSMMTWLISYM